MKIRLSFRVFASYVVVVLVGGIVTFATVRILAPHLFQQRVGLMRGVGMSGSNQAGVRTAFRSALNRALLIGVATSIAAAGAVALMVTRRLLHPLDQVRDATRRIAAGRYDVAVPLPKEPELAALAADVNTLATAMAETETRRTRLLGEVAHEMRTPLTALDGYVEGLIDGVFQPTPETLGSLGDELRRLHRLADDLSALSRAEEQRLDLRPTPTDVAELVRAASARLRPQFDDASVILLVEPGPTVRALIDPDRITQVLTNLLGNALAATPSGGTVKIGLHASEEAIEVSVDDTGVGLAPDDLERIFERFYRVPGQPRHSKGSGVGLTIARGIARAHRGDLTASSPGLGRGATFHLTLPTRPPDSSGR